LLNFTLPHLTIHGKGGATSQSHTFLNVHNVTITHVNSLSDVQLLRASAPYELTTSFSLANETSTAARLGVVDAAASSSSSSGAMEVSADVTYGLGDSNGKASVKVTLSDVKVNIVTTVKLATTALADITLGELLSLSSTFHDDVDASPSSFASSSAASSTSPPLPPSKLYRAYACFLSSSSSLAVERVDITGGVSAAFSTPHDNDAPPSSLLSRIHRFLNALDGNVGAGAAASAQLSTLLKAAANARLSRDKARAVYVCPGAALPATLAATNAAPFVAASSVSTLVGIGISVVLVVVAAIAVWLHLRRLRKSEQGNGDGGAYGGKESLLLADDDGGADVDVLDRSDETSSLLFHPHLHWILRYGVVIVCLALIALFLSSNLSMASATVNA
jgi:hypothetical protein